MKRLLANRLSVTTGKENSSEVAAFERNRDLVHAAPGF
jgi:hypothetical protein